MNTPAKTLDARLDEIARQTRRIESIHALVLFGSQARGDSRHGSDWNVALVTGREMRGWFGETALRVWFRRIARRRNEPQEEIVLNWLGTAGQLRNAILGTMAGAVASEGLTIVDKGGVAAKASSRVVEEDDCRERLLAMVRTWRRLNAGRWPFGERIREQGARNFAKMVIDTGFMWRGENVPGPRRIEEAIVGLTTGHDGARDRDGKALIREREVCDRARGRGLVQGTRGSV